ncbi:MAG: hypothetical protein U0992_20085 [Planctomycetaceae bacterium]
MMRPACARLPAVYALWSAVVTLAALAAGSALAQDISAMSVEEFMSRKEQWPRLQGTSLTIEGRRLGGGTERLFFVNCDLLFQFAEGVRPPMPTSKSIQVSGSIETRQGKQVFIISRIKNIPTDEERLADKRGRLPGDEAAPWYALADWASTRGGFYNDDGLKGAAADLRQHGIVIEYRKVGPSEVAPLFALAEKTKQLGLSQSLHDEIFHDAVRRELKAAQKGDRRQRDVALTHILNQLPGAGVPDTLDAATRKSLLDEYQQDPIKAYEPADADRRRLFHRLLYASAMLERIEMDAAPDGSNGYEIARRIDNSLAEYSELAMQYRKREIEYQLAHVPTLSREKLLELVDRLKPNEARAAEVTRQWLAEREAMFRERGPAGVVDYAQEYIELGGLNDTNRAAELYMEVFKQPAGQELARKHLVELGYEFDGTSWSKPAGGGASNVTDAIRQGVVRPGMTSEQVQAAFGGRPTTIVKFAVRGLVSELWVYAEQGVAIEFRRRGPEADAVAAEISDVTGP